MGLQDINIDDDIDHIPEDLVGWTWMVNHGLRLNPTHLSAIFIGPEFNYKSITSHCLYLGNLNFNEQSIM